MTIDTETITLSPAPDAPPVELLASHLGLKAGARVIKYADTTLTLTDDHHGYVIDFTNSSAVTVTVPAGLRRDFIVGISQGGTGQVTVAAGAGTAINEIGGLLATEARYAMLQLIAFQPDVYRLFGRTA